MFNIQYQYQHFGNWTKQKQYYEKWFHFVDSFTGSDVLPAIPISFREKYDSVYPSSSVMIDPKIKISCPGNKFVSSASSENRGSK